MPAGWEARDKGDPQRLAQTVLRWTEAAQDSPLYVSLARGIASDPQMLELVARIDNVPPLNLLFGGVKLLLTTDEPLAAWYPHLVGQEARTPDDEAFAAFKEFALARTAALTHLGSTRRTQTNEVGRSAAILPLLVEAAARWDQPVHLVDVGASAGLNLCLDRFDYDYGRTFVPAALPATRRLTLHCESRGGIRLPDSIPTVASRHGIDLMPVDSSEPEQAAWLEALVWPEHHDRLERLREAIAIRRETRVLMHAGDAAELVARVGAELPPGPMVMFHTVMTYQMSETQRADLDDAVVEVATSRPVARVWMEPTRDSAHPELRTGLTQGQSEHRGFAHAHGRWIDAH